MRQRIHGRVLFIQELFVSRAGKGIDCLGADGDDRGRRSSYSVTSDWESQLGGQEGQMVELGRVVIAAIERESEWETRECKHD